MPAERCAAGAGEVEIRVRATGLNFRDVLMALGLYPGGESPLSIECAGTVESVGKEVVDFMPGDDVIAIAPGSFSTTVLADSRLTVKKPSGMTFEEAATVPSIFGTAYHALVELAGLKRGERVLSTLRLAASAGPLWKWRKRPGLKFCDGRKRCKAQLLHSIGIRHVFDSAPWPLPSR